MVVSCLQKFLQPLEDEPVGKSEFVRLAHNFTQRRFQMLQPPLLRQSTAPVGCDPHAFAALSFEQAL